eukprot:TRINITY_DN18650_c0_g1_i1.p1 TRINITY_DN18650_c0_g1~~TRINITY_DN18650_c0_g1_i1.p1  ORF type:complete len:258 (-),score=41.19 TRINITY_DN18650_c0_g1_i1:184-957(-)
MFGPLLLDSLVFASDLALTGAFAAVISKFRSSRSSAGLSLQSLAAIVGARSLHLFSHVLGLHYRPMALTPTMFQFVDLFNAVLGFFCLYLLAVKFYNSYDGEKDSFGIQVLEQIGCLPKTGPLSCRPLAASLVLYASVAIIALMWYCVRESRSLVQGYYTCFYEALFAVALLPQLWMFQQEKRVSSSMAAFVIAVAASRLCVLGFWTCFPVVYPMLSPSNRGIQMASETVNILILSDFIFHWAKSKLRGEKDVVLPF